MSINKAKNEKNPRKYIIELTSKTIIFWVLGSSFLFVWIFILGVLVGRGYLSFGLMKEQFAVVQEMFEGKDPSESEAIPGPVKDPKLAFYDELSLKRDEAAKIGGQGIEANAALENRPIAEVHQPRALKPDSAVEPVLQSRPGGGRPVLETTPDQVSQKEPEPPEKSASAGKPAPENRTAAITRSVPVPQSVSASKTVRPVSKEKQETPMVKDKVAKEKVRQYVLSVGGFGDRGRALSLVRQLSSRGINASLSNTKRGGRPYYKVSCGPFETEKMADDFKKLLAGRVGIYGVVTRAGN